MEAPTAKLFSLARHSAIYSAGSALTKLLLFLMVPLYSHTILPKDLSLLAVLDPAEQFAYGLLSLGTLQAVFRFHRPEDSTEARAKALSSLFWLLAGIVVVFCGIFALAVSRIAPALVGDHPLARSCTLLTIATLGIRLLSVIGVGYLQSTHRAGMLVLMTFVGTLLFCLTNYIGLARNGQDIELVFWSRLWLLTPVVATGLYLARNALRSRVDTTLLKEMLRFSSPLILAAAANPILNFADRWMLTKLIGAESAGIYDISYRFGMIPGMLLVAPFLRTWHPTMYQASGGKDWSTFIRRLLLYYSFIGALVWAALTVFDAELLRLFSTDAYYSGHRVIGFVAAAQILYGLGWIAASGLATGGRTTALGAIVAFGAFSNVLLNLLWIPRYGFMGAAAATLAAFAIIFFAFVFFSRRERTEPLPWVRLAGMVGIAVVAVVGIGRVDTATLLSTLLLRGALLLPVAALLALLARLTPTKIRWMLEDLRSIRSGPK